MQGEPLIDTKTQQLGGSEGGKKLKGQEQISLFLLEHALVH